MSRLARLSKSAAVAQRFLGELSPFRWRLGAVGVASLLSAGLEVLRPWPIKWILDGALVPVEPVSLSPATVVWWGAGAALGIALLHSAIQYLRALRLADVQHRVTRGIRHRLFDHLTRLSPSFHARHKSGDLMMRLMGDVPMLSGMLVESSVELATRIVLVLAILGVMLKLDAGLTIALCAVLPILLLVVRAFASRLTVAVHKQRKKEGHLADFLHEAVAGAPAIQALGRTDHVVHRFARSNRRSSRAGLKATRWAARLSSSTEALLGTGIAAAMLVGSLRVLDGGLTPGELLVFLSYVRSLLKPVRSAAKHAEKVAKGTACGERILTLLDEREEVSNDPTLPSAPEEPVELRYERVHFRYADGEHALRGLSASFRRGELVALAGHSGAGKSTAVALAVRLFDPADGRVLLDGVPLDRWELGSLRERFGVCLQETVLFGESVRENLLLGAPEANDEELWAALADSGLDERVRALPDELETQLGAAGAGLSGGERRRLALARTLLRRSPVLIADEPFAGLDRATALRVRDALARYAEEHIVIVVCHDLDHLGTFDRVVLIDRGRVVADGAHAKLVECSVPYRTLLSIEPDEVRA
jgi:ABC-type multidrug transport system fused ATPase/permease subunit